jgi:hypothetical protein
MRQEFNTLNSARLFRHQLSLSLQKLFARHLPVRATSNMYIRANVQDMILIFRFKGSLSPACLHRGTTQVDHRAIGRAKPLQPSSSAKTCSVTTSYTCERGIP